MTRELICSGVLMLLVCGQVGAQPAVTKGEPEGNRYVKVRLALDATALVPGKPATLGVIFDITDDWHLYWRNPGDSGLPPTVKLKLPEGVTAGEIRWPAPKRHLQAGGILDNIFEKQLVLLYPLSASRSIKPGEIVVEADVDWLVCREKCVPGRANVKQRFTIAETASPSGDGPLFEEFKSHVPRSIDKEKDGIECRWNDHVLTITARQATRLIFFPKENKADIYPEDIAQNGKSDTGSMRLVYPKTVQDVDSVGGVLAVTRNGKEFWYDIECPIPRPTSGGSATKQGGERP